MVLGLAMYRPGFDLLSQRLQWCLAVASLVMNYRSRFQVHVRNS